MSNQPKWDWPALFAEATRRNDTLNDFCRRVGCAGGTASTRARRHGHVFAQPAKDERRRAAILNAAQSRETLTQFCVRIGCSQPTARKWAAEFGHTFAPTPKTRRRVLAWNANFARAAR